MLIYARISCRVPLSDDREPSPLGDALPVGARARRFGASAQPARAAGTMMGGWAAGVRQRIT